MRALWKIDSCQISSLVKYGQNKQTNKYIRTCHSYMVTENPLAAAVPARPINIGAPMLLAYIEAPICNIAVDSLHGLLNCKICGLDCYYNRV